MIGSADGRGRKQASLRHLLLLLSAAVPALALERFEAVEPAMGTLFRIVVHAESAILARQGFDAAFARARALDQQLSDYRADSELNRLCRSGRAQVSKDLFEVLRIAIDIASSSGGAFDPTLGSFTHLWRESRQTGRLPSPEILAEARRRTGWRRVKLDARTRTVHLLATGMQLDLGGIAKGFAADEMLAVLRQLALPQALVAASGDIALGDAPPGLRGWSVEVAGRSRILANRGVSTSGPQEQFAMIGGRRYAHIVDPHNGIGLTNAETVGVIANTATLADALATAGFVLDGAQARRLARRWKAVCLRGPATMEVEQTK